MEKKENHSLNNNKGYNTTQNDAKNFGKTQVNQVTLQAPSPHQVKSVQKNQLNEYNQNQY